ncbi:hypothetical protein SLA2020_054410 [Shorea laevis]
METEEAQPLTVPNPEPSLKSDGNVEATATLVELQPESTQLQCEPESLVGLGGCDSLSQPQAPTIVSVVVEKEEQKGGKGVVDGEESLGAVGVGDLIGGEENRGVLEGGDSVEPLSTIGGENGIEVGVDGKQSFLVGEDKSNTAEDVAVGDESDETGVPDMAGEKETMGGIEVADVVEKDQILEETEGSCVAEQTEILEETVVVAVADGRGTNEIEVSDVATAVEEETEGEMEEADVTDGTAMAELTDGLEELIEELTDGSEELTDGLETEVAEGIEEAKEVEGVSKTGGGKRKRAKNSKALGRAPSRKKAEEDVCFICCDGGDLVLCDRRGCPKAYHSSCVGRDEAYFQTKGQWNCGWHLCSNCKKNAYYMCYTCVFSLCKGCIKDAVIFSVRGNKGFCESCMKLITLIERNQQGSKETAQVDFDDKSTWEYLFKDYWIDLKGQLSITSDELAKAKNLWKGSELQASKQELPHEPYDSNNDIVSVVGAEGASIGGNNEWASQELLDVVMHMKNGDKSVLSRIELNQLILDYIKKHELHDRRNKSYVICDLSLKTLFGKPRVGHIEMLNLLDPHIFFTKEDSQMDDLQGTVVDDESNQLDADWNSEAMVKASKDKKRKTRKKGNRAPQSNLDDYAAIDMHNINLLYLRRNLVEDLLEDTEAFREKVVSAFVRIRISGAGQKQALYRLAQVVGIGKAAEPYRVGKKTTDFLLEILNLNKSEVISIDIISNQEFTEDECKRLRQSIKCGLIDRLSVGDVQEKAMTLQAARVKDVSFS